MKTPDGVEELSRAEATIKDLEILVDRHMEQKKALNQDLQRFKAQRDLLDGALTNKNQTVSEQERRIEELEAENARLREALEEVDSTLCNCRNSLSKSACNCDIHAAHRSIHAALNPTKEARK